MVASINTPIISRRIVIVYRYRCPSAVVNEKHSVAPACIKSVVVVTFPKKIVFTFIRCPIVEMDVITQYHVLRTWVNCKSRMRCPIIVRLSCCSYKFLERFCFYIHYLFISVDGFCCFQFYSFHTHSRCYFFFRNKICCLKMGIRQFKSFHYFFKKICSLFFILIFVINITFNIFYPIFIYFFDYIVF